MESNLSNSDNFRKSDRWNSVPVPDAVARRAISNMDKQAGGCWISRYSTASHGYAQIGWNTGEVLPNGRRKIQMVLAHRAAWTLENGQVPVGMTLDHTCKTRRCVNPAHLRLLPNHENARRTSGSDWPVGTCKRGHSNEHLKKYKKSAVPKGYVLECSICHEARMIRNRFLLRHPGEPVPPDIARNTTSEDDDLAYAPGSPKRAGFFDDLMDRMEEHE